MIVSIHQPNYLPYLGFFDKIRLSDVFVILDDAQFVGRDYHHRNKIRTSQGWQWLTVPVDKKRVPIKDIKINNKSDWANIHFTAIRANYLKTPFFRKYETDINRIYEKNYEMLVDLNVELILFLLDAFKINTKILYSSEFGFNSKSTQKLIDIVEALGTDTYLSGSGGRKYMNCSLFEKNNIKLEFQDFKHPVYPQRHPDFVPNMAAIDALFNLGASCLDGKANITN